MRWFIRWFVQMVEVIFRLLFRLGKKDAREPKEYGEMKQNPYLPYLREILKGILKIYHLDYQEFHPLLLDTDVPPQSMLDADDVELVLKQISKDLNFLRIATERPAYFTAYIDTMYEETGLVVQLQSKQEMTKDEVNVILDMEQCKDRSRELIEEGIHYLPVYKKPWNQAENLDISVPIGYNTVIVKGIRENGKHM